MFKQLIGSRKFIVMLSIILSGIIFRCINFINGSEFVDLLKVTGAAFFAANVGSNLIGAIKDKAKEKLEEIKDKIK